MCERQMSPSATTVTADMAWTARLPRNRAITQCFLESLKLLRHIESWAAALKSISLIGDVAAFVLKLRQISLLLVSMRS